MMQAFRHLGSSPLFALSAIASLISCSDPAAARRGCPFEPADRCWVNLGLDTALVTSVALTDEGLLAGTRSGLVRLDSQTGQWLGAGLTSKTVTSITSSPASGVWVTIAPHGADTTDAVAYWRSASGAPWLARDGGLAAQVGYQTGACSFAVDPADPANLYLGLGAQVAKSSDSGTTWTYVYGASSDRGLCVLGITFAGGTRRLYAGGQDARATGFVLRSDDGGATWARFQPDGLYVDAAASLAGNPLDQDRLFVGMRSALWATTDGGASWSRLFTTRRPAWVNAIVVDRGRVYALSDEDTTVQGLPSSALGLWVSDDYGGTWAEAPVPGAARGALAAVITADGRLIIATRGGVWSVATK